MLKKILIIGFILEDVTKIIKLLGMLMLFLMRQTTSKMFNLKLDKIFVLLIKFLKN